MIPARPIRDSPGLCWKCWERYINFPPGSTELIKSELAVRDHLCHPVGEACLIMKTSQRKANGWMDGWTVGPMEEKRKGGQGDRKEGGKVREGIV